MKKWFRKLFGNSDAPPQSAPPVQQHVPQDPEPPTAEALEALRRKLEPHRRTAWVPVISDAPPGDEGQRGSHFSGIAHIPAGMRWPDCPGCQQPMQLFVQLDGASLPDEWSEQIGNRLLQFFYCINSGDCEISLHGWEPFSKAGVLRLVHRETDNQVQNSPLLEPFPTRRVVDWKPVDDYPNWEEMPDLGLELSDDEADAMEALDHPVFGEKLGGWPAWVQGVEYPDCPECGERMRLVFQIDSENNVPYMWGDAGVGHVTQCKRHPGVLAFGWACY